MHTYRQTHAHTDKHTWWQRQYVGSLGSTGISNTSVPAVVNVPIGGGVVIPDGLNTTHMWSPAHKPACIDCTNRVHCPIGLH